MAKIKLTDNLQDVVAKMAGGNPGACMALCEMIKQGAGIDPQGFMGGLGAILSLDTLGIYGTDIYILYNDQCKRDIRKMLMLLRANQFGFLGSGEIKAVAADQLNETRFSEEKMNELDNKVCSYLKSFRPSKQALEVKEKTNENSNSSGS